MMDSKSILEMGNEEVIKQEVQISKYKGYLMALQAIEITQIETILTNKTYVGLSRHFIVGIVTETNARILLKPTKFFNTPMHPRKNCGPPKILRRHAPTNNNI